MQILTTNNEMSASIAQGNTRKVTKKFFYFSAYAENLNTSSCSSCVAFASSGSDCAGHGANNSFALVYLH